MNKVLSFSVIRTNPSTGLPVTRNEYSRFHIWARRQTQEGLYHYDAVCTNERNIKLKTRVINHYGGRCATCGITDIRVLELHHKNHDGKEHRAHLRTSTSTTFYRALEKDNYPKWPGLIVLCANCHAITQWQIVKDYVGSANGRCGRHRYMSHAPIRDIPTSREKRVNGRRGELR